MCSVSCDLQKDLLHFFFLCCLPILEKKCSAHTEILCELQGGMNIRTCFYCFNWFLGVEAGADQQVLNSKFEQIQGKNTLKKNPKLTNPAASHRTVLQRWELQAGVLLISPKLSFLHRWSQSNLSCVKITRRGKCSQDFTPLRAFLEECFHAQVQGKINCHFLLLPTLPVGAFLGFGSSNLSFSYMHPITLGFF